MKINVVDQLKNKVGVIELPWQFKDEFRPDLIQRAVLTVQSHKRQPYGASQIAGKRVSAKLSRRRRDYRGSYGFGISRVPRKILSRRGSRMNWVGAFAPGTVGGRRAHPPKVEKILWRKINDKERLKATRSAIAATMMRDVVIRRGHLVPADFPFILEDKFETLDKTKNIFGCLKKLGFGNELERVSERKVRAGKGKSRSKKYRKKKGPLIIVSKLDKIGGAASNIPGVSVVEVKGLNTELLAPGGKPGRLALWTTTAIQTLEKENLFSRK